ncbi:MAG: hypothetical protein ABII22_01190 [Candidatus Micrarchaeota archaeon]
MQKLNVHYSPTPANLKIIRAIQRFQKAQSCDFIGLPQVSGVRISALMALDGKVAFVWGDGQAHHESYFFTLNRVKAKMNVDWHGDTTYSPYVGPSSHMAWTQNQGVKIATGFNQHRELDKLIGFGLRFGNSEVALTIDCDGIINFPMQPKFMEFSLDQNNRFPDLYFEDVVRLIQEVGPRIQRLDIGGLIENIPDFDLVDLEGRFPSRKEIFAFLGHKPDIYPLTPATTNKVCSYVVNIYASILEAFAQIPFIPAPEPEPPQQYSAFDFRRF